MMVCRTGFEWVGPKHHRGTAMEYYAGIDVSLKESSVCVVDGTGKIIREAKMRQAPRMPPQFRASAPQAKPCAAASHANLCPLSRSWALSTITLQNAGNLVQCPKSGKAAAPGGIPRSNHTLRFFENGRLIQTDPATLADGLPASAWTTHPAGEGSQGIRLYQWARLALQGSAEDGFERWLLFRRSRHDPKDLAY